MLSPPLRLVPQAGPAVWRGADLTPADWMLPLGAEEAAEMEAALSAPPGDAAPPGLPRLAPLLRQAAERLETGRGFVLLRGLPLERLEAAAAGRPEAALRLIGGQIGTPLPQDAAGTLVAALAGEDAEEAAAAGEAGPVRFQADPADAVLLLCLRQAAEGGSVALFSAPALHNALLRADRAALATLHEGLPRRGCGAPVPVFSTAGGAFVGHCDHAALDGPGLTEPQRKALAALDAAAAAPGQAVRLALHPGDLLLRNPLLVWKRGSPRGAGQATTGRELLRLWLSTPGSRALPESFRAVFGAVDAGARRGGVPPAAAAATGGPGMVGG